MVEDEDREDMVERRGQREEEGERHRARRLQTEDISKLWARCCSKDMVERRGQREEEEGERHRARGLQTEDISKLWARCCSK